MQYRSSFFMVVCSLSILSRISNAEVGTLADVIQAAKNGKEPAYIKELIVQLSAKLQVHASSKNLDSAGEYIAWLYSMGSVVEVSWNAAYHAAPGAAGEAALNAADKVARDAAYAASLDASCNTPLHSARKAASNAVRDVAYEVSLDGGYIAAVNADKKAAWYDVFAALNSAQGTTPDTAAWYAAYSTPFTAARNTAYKGAYAAARKAAFIAATIAISDGSTFEEAGVIANRAAEWGALNYVFDNIGDIVDVTFTKALELPKVSTDNPFESLTTWRSFCETYFADLTDEAMIFLVPWLDILDSSMFVRYGAPNGLLALNTFLGSTFLDVRFKLKPNEL